MTDRLPELPRAKGDSTSATFPRLNGQQAHYIAAQLKNFRATAAAIRTPWPICGAWRPSSTTRRSARSRNIYAGQKPTEPQTGGALAAEGKKIYMNGVEAHNVPPCAACHGDHGEGNGEMPRLAGQHADYLKNQLEDFRSLLRNNQSCTPTPRI